MAHREAHLSARRWTFSKASGEQESAPISESSATRMLDYFKNMSLDEKARTLPLMKKFGVEGFLNKCLEDKLGSADAEAELRECYKNQRLMDFLSNLAQEVEQSKSKENNEQGDIACPEANRSTTKGGSKTALGTCRFRYIAAILGFGPDHLARLFLSENVRESQASLIANFVKHGIVPDGGKPMKATQDETPHAVFDRVSFLQCRTCLGDDALLQWVKDYASGCNIVLLGAGYDTKFYRLSLPATAQLFEIDAAGTQEEKLRMLHEASGDLPSKAQVTYVAVDFQTESWMERVISKGLNKELPTLIVWEGVTYYLPREVVEKTLHIVAREFSGPAAIYFDYFHPELVEARKEIMEALGEPWLFGISSADLVALLSDIGLKELDHLSVHECVQRYMPIDGQGESLGVGSPWKFFVIAGNQLCPS